MAYRINVTRENQHKILLPAIFESCGSFQKLSIVESDYLDELTERITALTEALEDQLTAPEIEQHPLLSKTVKEAS